MSNVNQFKCPACGGALEYRPGQKAMVCPYCGTTVEEESILQEAVQGQPETAAVQEQAPVSEEATQEKPEGEELRSYHCQNCGAEIVTGPTTAATRCYYCHSPVVLNPRLSDAFRPDGVIPFQMELQEAKNRFQAFIAKKRFVRKDFVSPQQLEDFSGVYYPYWMDDVTMEASFDGEATTVSSIQRGAVTETHTRHYQLHREGTLQVNRLQRKALNQTSRLLSDGIQPFQMDGMRPFASEYLSGFLAESRDVTLAEAQADMEKEAQGMVYGAMTHVGDAFHSVKGNAQVHKMVSRMRYVLFPVWVLTYRGQGKESFYYMMNGQTGQVCGKLPLDTGKLGLFSAICGLAVAGLLCLGGAMLW